LHIAPAIGHEIDVYGAAFYAVDYPIGFEKDLPEIADTQYR
jgi:hypothetical protein